MQATGSQTAAWPRIEPRTFFMWSVFLFRVTNNYFQGVSEQSTPSKSSVAKDSGQVLNPLCGLERSESVPSPPRRSWWRTPTAAQSLSASPWCLCRSQCHPASTCSTSPGRDKGEGFMATCRHIAWKNIYQSINVHVLLNSRPPFFPCCHTSLPPTRYSGI